MTTERLAPGWGAPPPGYDLVRLMAPYGGVTLLAWAQVCESYVNVVIGPEGEAAIVWAGPIERLGEYALPQDARLALNPRDLSRLRAALPVTVAA